VKIPLEYSVTDTSGVKIRDIYIPDSGTYDYPVWVKFLTGNAVDKVTLSFSGLPADVKVTPDSFSAKPSYIEHFVFYTNGAVRATYPITLIAYTPTGGYKYYSFNLGVIPAQCTKAFLGPLYGSNSCSRSGKNHYTAIATAGANKNLMNVNNFGGYGSNVNVEVRLDCTNDSVYIIDNNWGNNVRLSGKGIFTGSKLIISYNATSTPSGLPDNCVDTLSVLP